MKKSKNHNFIKSLSGLLIVAFVTTVKVNAQSYSDRLVKELSFEKTATGNTLIVGNINGSLHVEGYAGDKILIEVERTIKAKTTERLELGKKEIQLATENLIDTLIVSTSERCNKFQFIKDEGKERWAYNWSCERGDCTLPYSYVMNFTIKVPFGINVAVSTINDGDVLIEKVSGLVKANNINGHIKLTSLKRATEAHTINGNVDLEYEGNPPEASKFYTLNGDINAWFQKGLAANLSFKSFQGELFTNLNELESLPSVIEKEPYKDGVKYKVSNSRFKASKGGSSLDFETFNGNVILKER
jgi:hypothetical protein